MTSKQVNEIAMAIVKVLVPLQNELDQLKEQVNEIKNK